MNSELLLLFFEKYHRELYLYLYSLCHNPSLAEDLVQETFLKAILSLPDDHANVRAWLYMVARNLYFNQSAKNRRELPLEEWQGREPGSEEEILERLLLDERVRLLYQALSKLSNQKREVITLQYFGGFSQREIATMMQLSPENVRVLGHRAKKELKAYMEVLEHEV